MAPKRSSLYHTMSNPNTNALMSLLTDAVRDPKLTAAGFKIIYVGKDKYPLSVLEMAPVEADGWKKSAAFESLSSTIRGQMDIHDTADLVSVMSQEMPIDVTTAFMESSTLKSAIISSMTDVCNLTGLSFLNSNGEKAKTLKSCDLKDRPSDLAYIKLVCCLDGSVIDQRVTQAPVDFQFCLKLPQSSYDTQSGSVIPLSSPTKTRKNSEMKSKSQVSPREKLIFDPTEAGSDSDEDSNAESPKDATPAKDGTLSSTPVTPSMSMLIGTPNSNSSITSFFGDMTFLDDQKVFDDIFGDNPVILSNKPKNASIVNCLPRARIYADKCMLEHFIATCRDDYVGGNDHNSMSKMIHEICKQLQNLKQSHGRGEDTPDELYAKYLSIAAGLPDDANMWSITLCSSYFCALTTSLKDKMEECGFSMPPLNAMSHKSSQIQGLRLVRTAAVTAYKALKEEEKRLRRLFPNMGQQRQNRGGNLNQYEGGDIYYSNRSQAEQTLSRYGNGGGTGQSSSQGIPTKRGADGRMYPYHPDDPSYISKFDIDFKGCFKCGKEDHSRRDQCPIGYNASRQQLEAFYKELHIHKPHLARPNYGNQVSYMSYSRTFLF